MSSPQGTEARLLSPQEAANVSLESNNSDTKDTTDAGLYNVYEIEDAMALVNTQTNNMAETLTLHSETTNAAETVAWGAGQTEFAGFSLTVL